MCIIFRIVPPPPTFGQAQLREDKVTDRFLAYVCRYDIIPQSHPGLSPTRGLYPEPASSLYALKRAKRSNDQKIGDIVPLEQIQALADVTPRFGATANRQLTKETSLIFSTEFWLNKYFDREFFYSMTLM